MAWLNIVVGVPVALLAVLLLLALLLVADIYLAKRRYASFRRRPWARPLLRTPDARFEALPDYPFAPHYVEIDGLRMHYVDEGPRDAAPILLLHGEPSWSFLYRKMIPPLVAAGHRVIAPDLIGFGRSDKLTRQIDYTYQMHVDSVVEFVKQLELRDVTLFCQDWGGLIGLWVALEEEARFARIMASNTGLPGKPPRGNFQPVTERGKRTPWYGFAMWFVVSQTFPDMPIGRIIQTASRSKLPPEVIAAYDAPFPSRRYKAGARKFPRLVVSEFEKNTVAWRRYAEWNKPFLTAFASGDPITRGIDRAMQRVIPGAQGQPHTIVRGAGHFIQEDKGEELADMLIAFIRTTA
jgi:haloalkane dehalogenase